MSELLDESRQRKDKAIEDKKTCGNGLSYGLFKGKEMAWEEAVDLIEKHEKPKGLIQTCPPEWMNKYLALNKKQQEIYETLMKKYRFSDLNFADDDNIYFVIEWACEENNYRDKDLIPALKKFLSEVEE